MNLLGHAAILIACDEVDNADQALVKRATLQTFTALPPRQAAVSPQQVAWLWRHRRDIAFIHLHGLFGFTTVLVLLLSVSTGTPYSVQPHGSLEPYQRQQGRLKKYIWNVLLGDFLLRRARLVVAASSSEGERIRALHRVPVLISPPGVPGAEVTPTAPPGGSMHESQGAPQFLFVGRYARKKRPDLLLKAWAVLRAALPPNSRLVLAGPDSDLSLEVLRSMAQRLDLQESVSLLPEVSAAERAWLMQAADVFVLPSENENFGQTVTEALASGCTVVTTPDVASHEYVLASGNGVVAPTDTATDLAAAMAAAARLRQQDPELAERARTFVVETLSWPAAASRLIAAMLPGGDESATS